MAPRSRPSLALAMMLAGACRVSDAAAATPQRPTVSFDTSTTSVGTVELESGGAWDPRDAADTPATLKHGVRDGSELFVGWSPWLQLQRPGADANGPGDLVLGMRQRVFGSGGGDLSGALVLSGKLPTASDASGLGSGEPDVRLGAIVNRSLGAVNANLFYQYGALGDALGGSDDEHTLTLTLGVPLGGDVAMFHEVGATWLPEQDQQRGFWIPGVAWAVRPWCVLDCALNVGLGDDAPDLQLFVGSTINFGAVGR